MMNVISELKLILIIVQDF